jgi:glycosyltransferase involved in cell wall biosynthesis
MNISIVIPTLNRADDLKECLASICEQTARPDEVIVVDQSADDTTRLVCEHMSTMVSQGGSEFRYVHQEEKSSARARNRGLALARGDVIGFFDDDTILAKDYCDVIMQYLNEHQEVGGVSGKMIMEEAPSGWKWMLRRLLMKVFLLGWFDGRMTSSGFGYPCLSLADSDPSAIEMLPGCNMVFRAELLRHERFDEWFTGYSFREDVDLSYRIARRAKLAMIPEARVYHKFSTVNRMDARRLKAMEVRNYHYVYQKLVRKNAISDALFVHSLMGLFVMYAVECVFKRRKEKVEQLVGFVSGIWMLLARPCGREAKCKSMAAAGGA